MTPKKVILFDLGNTLVEYYHRHQWQAVVEETIGAVEEFLRSKNLLTVAHETIWYNVEHERHDPPDHRVIPLAERLSRVFVLDSIDDDIKNQMCRAFLTPIFGRGRIYGDTLPCLKNLRSCGLRIGIVSNTPWGSGGDLWREELKRLDLFDMVDEAIFCTDAGWRKPAHQIFDYALAKFAAVAGDCVFVGDDPRWDIEGSRAIGMDAVLIDRTPQTTHPPKTAVQNLDEFVKLLHII
jgi:putative hydrolase of the HAD superfamily